ncbi:hypothetical protein DN512_30825, partial [Burkholderia multivorans]
RGERAEHRGGHQRAHEALRAARRGSITSCGKLDQGSTSRKAVHGGVGGTAGGSSVERRRGGRRACNKTGPARGLCRFRSTQRAGKPASNGGVHAGSNPVITKTLKKADSASLPMFRKMLKILKRVDSLVSQCGKSG